MSFVKFQNCILENADENSVQISGNVVPTTTNTYSLGSQNQSWNSLNIGPWTIASRNAGTLDRTFGDNGTVSADFSMNSASIATSVVVDNCNNIIVGGFDIANNSIYAFAKYTNSGILDTTFGNNGIVFTDLSNNNNYGEFNIFLYTSFKINAIDSNNNIILSGYVGTIDLSASIFVSRYLPNGQIDTTFGQNGITFANFSGNDGSEEYSVIVDQQDNIIVVGRDYDISNNIYYYGLARFLPSGILDVNFGNEGTIISNFSENDYSAAISVAIDKNNNIVIAGIANNSAALARYLPTGILDLSFGVQGTVITDFSGNNSSTAISLAIDESNNIVVAGTVAAGYLDAAYVVTRYLSTGSLDISFGTQGTGIVVTTFNLNDYYAQANSITIDQHNNIIVAGFNINNSNTSFVNYTLAKYLPNGTLDNTFGDSGVVVTVFSQNNNNSLHIANSVAIDQNNNIIVSGFYFDYYFSINYALAKYFNNTDLIAQLNGSGVTYSILGPLINN